MSYRNLTNRELQDKYNSYEKMIDTVEGKESMTVLYDKQWYLVWEEIQYRTVKGVWDIVEEEKEVGKNTELFHSKEKLQEEPKEKVILNRTISDLIVSSDMRYAVGEAYSVLIDGINRFISVTKIHERHLDEGIYDVLGEWKGERITMFTLIGIPVILKYKYTSK